MASLPVLAITSGEPAGIGPELCLRLIERPAIPARLVVLADKSLLVERAWCRYLCPLGALIAAIIFYWIMGDKFAYEQMQLGREKPVGKWMIPFGKYVYCGISILVIILGIAFGGI